MNGVEDRVLDMTERIASLHASSLRPRRTGLFRLLDSRRRGHAAHTGNGPPLRGGAVQRLPLLDAAALKEKYS
jgi:hypothetical protein